MRGLAGLRGITASLRTMLDKKKRCGDKISQMWRPVEGKMLTVGCKSLPTSCWAGHMGLLVSIAFLMHDGSWPEMYKTTNQISSILNSLPEIEVCLPTAGFLLMSSCVEVLEGRDILFL